jgi:hypothetical protein
MPSLWRVAHRRRGNRGSINGGSGDLRLFGRPQMLQCKIMRRGGSWRISPSCRSFCTAIKRGGCDNPDDRSYWRAKGSFSSCPVVDGVAVLLARRCWVCSGASPYWPAQDCSEWAMGCLYLQWPLPLYLPMDHFLSRRSNHTQWSSSSSTFTATGYQANQ